MRIAVTDNMGAEKKFQYYTDWLTSGAPDVQWVKISYALDNLAEINSCDGVLLTGGGDVDPAAYGATTVHPKVYGIDQKRDYFERKVIDETLYREKPLLGICRGLQIANVHFGGTLVQDLDELGHPNHSTKNDNGQTHEIAIITDGILSGITNIATGEINSFHHQSVDAPGAGLVVTATSKDGVVEAVEMQDGASKSFFLLIQWHPERMSNVANPFNQNVLQRFLKEIQKKKKQSN